MATDFDLTHELSISWVWFKMTAMGRMEDALTFLPLWAGSILAMVLYIVFFNAIFAKTQSLGGWSYGEVMVLLGVVRIIQAIAWGFWSRGGFPRLYRSILKGTLDSDLVKPMNLRVQFIFNNADFVTLIEGLVLGIGLIWYGLSSIHVQVQWTMFLFILFCACVIHYSVVCLFSSINFWTLVRDFGYLMNETFDLGKYPITIYRGAMRWFLTLVIPLGCIYTFPSRALLGTLTVQELLIMMAVTVVFYLLGLSVWKLGLKRYESALS